jgi:hypothetical protein
MGQGVLMESSLEGAPPARSGADAGFISVVVPVVERADDLVALYQSFSAELEARGSQHEFIFVFDGGFAHPPGLSTLSQERETSGSSASPGPSARRRRCGSGSSEAGET